MNENGETMEKIKKVKLAPQHIRIDGGTQPREELDETAVNEYAEDLANGESFPPCVVYYDGSNNWLADGFHRYHAAVKAKKALLCEQRPGTRRDAVLYSNGANKGHGVRRKPADKRRQVTGMLEDAEWQKWSDRDIAKHCGVSHEFVRQMRQKTEPLTVNVDSENGENNQELTRKYTTKHGTVAEMNVANIGKKAVTGNPISETNPTLDNAHNDDIFDDYDEDPEEESVDDADPAEQYANATVVSDTIAPLEPKGPRVDENDLTDDEWLMTLPIFKLLVSRGDKALILRADALAWRTMQQNKAFGSFRHHAQKAFDFGDLQTPFARLIYKASHVKHPNEWGGCVTCRGKGCTNCGYSGAVMDGGLTIEQMEAKR